MKANIDRFKTLVRKATLNMNIESVHLNITQDVISSNMITSGSNGMLMLNLENDIFSNIKKGVEYDFYFSEPNQILMPFLNLIDEDEADIRVNKESITISSGGQKSRVHFASPTVVNTSSRDALKDGPEPFLSIAINDDFYKICKKVKAVGSRFGKVYFTVDGKMFKIEVTDKTNQASSCISFDLSKIKHKDITMCFDYKNFADAITVLGGDNENFVIKFYYVEEKDMGMLFIRNMADTERYFLLSMIE